MGGQLLIQPIFTRIPQTELSVLLYTVNQVIFLGDSDLCQTKCYGNSIRTYVQSSCSDIYQ